MHILTQAEIKNIIRLHDTKGRLQAALFIVEGLRAITTVLNGGLTLKSLYCTQEQSIQAQKISEDVRVVSDKIMKKMSTASTPSGLLAIFKIPKSPQPHTLSPGLVLVEIQDPGNMGTLIRTAAACNIRSIVIIEGTDPWSPKVVQASAGTIAHVQIFLWDWQTLVMHKHQYRLYALVVSGGNSLDTVDASKALLVVGNEARGIPAELLAQCDESITLPMPGGTESLNAAVAGSIALYIAFCKKNT